jgi:hypothetical protein
MRPAMNTTVRPEGAAPVRAGNFRESLKKKTANAEHSPFKYPKV